MKNSKLICLTIILTFIIAPATNNQMVPVQGDFEFTEIWDYKGIITRQNRRIRYTPIFGINPSMLRTFIFFLDDANDTDTDIDTIVALHGINPLRNAPLHSLIFESTSIGAEYGFNVSSEAGMEWVDVDYDSDVVNSSSSSYDPAIEEIYDIVTESSKYSLPELYDNITFPTYLVFPVHIANFVTQTGIVGHWRQINKDQTVINGNFTTFGADNPIFTGPVNETDPTDIAYPEDQWWPQFNVTVAQNVERTSRPRTHSFQVNFPFTTIVASFALVFLIFTFVKKSRRKTR